MESSDGPVKVRVCCLGFIADLPAEAYLRNAVSHSGYYGCRMCEIQGKSVLKGNGHTMAYVRQDGENSQLRTHASTLLHAQHATVKDPVMIEYLTLFTHQFLLICRSAVLKESH